MSLMSLGKDFHGLVGFRIIGGLFGSLFIFGFKVYYSFYIKFIVLFSILE